MTARFGDFELDLRSGELRTSGGKVPLQDLPFRLLSILIERAGDVVTREELRERLWPAEFVDFEHGLNTAVRKLRTALGDSADEPRFIETLARRGYRFIAPVTWSEDQTSRLSTRRRVAVPVAIALAVIGLVVAAITLRPEAASSSRIWSVAVLPFTYSDPQTEHIGDGVTEVLIDTLSRLPDVRVIAATTVFRYKGRDADPKKVGEELDVGAVVVGDIRREDDRYRMRVELIDAEDGTRVWGDRFEVPVSQLASAQSRITDELTRRLRHDRRGPPAYTKNAEAYELYLKGLHAWNQRTKENMHESVEYFSRAVDLDPTFAAAWAGLAHAWGVMVGNGLVAPEDGVPKVMAAARKALELDPASAEAHTSIATTKFRNEWDFAGAEQDYRRALSLNPSYATAHQWYSDYLRAMGRFDEARRETEIAYQLDPLSRAITGAKCWSLFYDRRYEAAIAFASRAGTLGERYRPMRCELEAYVALGQYDAAVAMLEKQGDDSSRAVVEAYRRRGPRGLMETYLELMLKEPRREYRFPIEIAEAYARIGDRDKAFEWLEIAYRHRVSRVTSFQLHPAFDSLRDDARFTDLLRRIGLPRVDIPSTGETPSTRRSSGSPDRS